MLQADPTASLISNLIRERILLLDGAMGTMIQRLKLDEAAVRGDRFAGHHKDLKNFSDILCLTHPEKITDIHRAYFEAGSDIVETNSFGASAVGMIEFDLPLDINSSGFFQEGIFASFDGGSQMNRSEMRRGS